MNVGDRVRILVKKAKEGIAYKTYKNLTWSKSVYKITQKTKTAVPAKYRVNRTWYLIDSIVLSAEVDKDSELLLASREDKLSKEDEKKIEIKLKELEKPKKRKQRAAKVKAMQKMVKAQRAQNEVDKLIDGSPQHNSRPEKAGKG